MPRCSVHRTPPRHPKIYEGRIKPEPWSAVAGGLALLERRLVVSDREERRRVLAQVVPEMQDDAASDRPAPAPERERVGQAATLEPSDAHLPVPVH